MDVPEGGQPLPVEFGVAEGEIPGGYIPNIANSPEESPYYPANGKILNFESQYPFNAFHVDVNYDLLIFFIFGCSDPKSILLVKYYF